MVDNVFDQDAAANCPERQSRLAAASAASSVVLEILGSVALAIWLLAQPAVFRWYYPIIGAAERAIDATTIVDWLHSDRRERSLNLALAGGQLTAKELRHYSDVRRALKWPPRVVIVTAVALLLLALLHSGKRQSSLRAHRAGLALWLGFCLLLVALASWDWKALFAWLHYPLFGFESWRFPKDAYSLELFPASFWRVLLLGVFLAPTLILGLNSAKRRTSKHEQPPNNSGPIRGVCPR